MKSTQRTFAQLIFVSSRLKNKQNIFSPGLKMQHVLLLGLSFKYVGMATKAPRS